MAESSILLEGRIRVPLHRHLLVLYHQERERFRWAGFLIEGLRQGSVCVHLAPQEAQRRMLEILRARRKESEVLGKEEGTLFFPQAARARPELWNIANGYLLDAEKQGAPDVRWLEELDWLQSTDGFFEEHFEFEAKLNLLVKLYPTLALCHCPIDRIKSVVGLSVLALHRHLLIGDELIENNPLYIPPERFLAMSRKAREAELFDLMRQFGFDMDRLVESLRGYGRLGAEG